MRTVENDGRAASCTVFDDFQVTPSHSATFSIWQHLQSCSPCMEKFQAHDGPARDFLCGFEFQHELNHLRYHFRDCGDQGQSGPSERSVVESAPNEFPSIPGLVVEDRLGRGGSSDVWLARQEGLNRTVALKIMHKISSRQKARLQKECQILASLSHPYLLPIFASGVHGDKVWMALEYCPGGSLNYHLEQFWDPKLAASLVRKIALAAQAVHEKGIIHRDIKPGNILIGADGEPKLADFDLARSTLAGQESTRQTQILGTPAYIAPEQVHSKKVDARADVHALGGVLYHLLTDRPPFKADSTYEALLMAVHIDPVPPVVLRPGLPKDLDQICRKCLSKTPADRYATALDLAADLERFHEGRPVKARPLSKLKVAWRWANRNRGLATTGLAAVLSLFCVAIVSAIAAYQAIEFARMQQAEAERALRSEKKAIWELYVNRINKAQYSWENGDIKAAQDLLDQCPFGLRGWEHNYLNTLFRAKWMDLAKEPAKVSVVAITPDDQFMATLTKPATISIWDFKTRRKIHGFSGNNGEINALRFSPDSKMIASCSKNGEVNIWEMSSGLRRTFHLFENKEITDILFTKSFSPLICSGADGSVSLWRWGTDDQTIMRDVSEKRITTLALSPDGGTVLSGGEDGILRELDAETLKITSIFEARKSIKCICFSPDGKRIATGNRDDVEPITLWDAKTRSVLKLPQGHTGGVTSLAFGMNGDLLISAGEDRRVILWDGVLGRVVEKFIGHLEPVQSVCLHSSAQVAISGAEDGCVKIWDLNNQQFPVFKSKQSGNTWNCLKALPKKNQVIAGTAHGEIYVFSGEKLTVVDVIKAHEKSVESIDISDDESLLLCGSADETVSLWDLKGGRLLHRIANHRPRAAQVRFLDKGRKFVTTSRNQGIKLWETLTGKECGEFQTEDFGKDYFRLEVLPDEKTIVTACTGSRHLLFWDYHGRRLSKKIEFPEAVQTFAKSTDGANFLVIGGSKMIYMLESLNADRVIPINRSGASIISAEFSYDGELFVTTDQDAQIKIWKTSAREPLLRLKDNSDWVTHASFSRDGRTLYACGWDLTIRAYSSRYKDPLFNITDRVGHFSESSLPQDSRENSPDLPIAILPERDAVVLKGESGEKYLLDYKTGLEKAFKAPDQLKGTEVSGKAAAGGYRLLSRDGEIYIVDNKADKCIRDDFEKFVEEALSLKRSFDSLTNKSIGRSLAFDEKTSYKNILKKIEFNIAKYQHEVEPNVSRLFMALSGKRPSELLNFISTICCPVSSKPCGIPVHGSIWTRGGGRCFPNDDAYAALLKDGSVATWGESSSGGDCSKVASKLQSGVVRIFSNRSAFAALKDNGELIVWGNPKCGADVSSVREKLLNGVVSVASTPYAFAAIKDDGSLVVWGDPRHGGDASTVREHLQSGVIAVYSNRCCFAALKNTGELITWGCPTQDQPNIYSRIVRESSIVKICSDDSAFALLRGDGSVAVWGNDQSGGEPLKASAQLTSGVKDIFATSGGFAALKDDGSVIAWGHYGSFCSSLEQFQANQIESLYATIYSIAGVKKDRTVFSWGSLENIAGTAHFPHQKNKNVQRIYCTGCAFAALRSDGSVFSWGGEVFGGDSSKAERHLSTGVESIVGNFGAFAAIKTDGSIVTWGRAESGGDSSKVSSQLRSGVKRVFCNRHSFVALKSDGSIVSWGEAGSGGDSSKVAPILKRGIVTISSANEPQP